MGEKQNAWWPIGRHQPRQPWRGVLAATWLIILLLSLPLGAQERTWTSATGQQIRGELVKFDGQRVWLKLAKSGAVQEMPLSVFSPEDQRWLLQGKSSEVRPADAGTAPAPSPVPARPRTPEEIRADVARKLAEKKGMSPGPADAPAATAAPSVLTFAGDRYEKAHEHRDGTRVLIEYVRPPEKIEQWNKLVALHHFPQLADPGAAANELARVVQQHNPLARFDRINQDDGTEAIIDFLTWEAGAGRMEFNIFRYRKVPGTPGLLAYQFAWRIRVDELTAEQLRAARLRLRDELTRANFGNPFAGNAAGTPPAAPAAQVTDASAAAPKLAQGLVPPFDPAKLNLRQKMALLDRYCAAAETAIATLLQKALAGEYDVAICNACSLETVEVIKANPQNQLRIPCPRALGNPENQRELKLSGLSAKDYSDWADKYDKRLKQLHDTTNQALTKIAARHNAQR